MTSHTHTHFRVCFCHPNEWIAQKNTDWAYGWVYNGLCLTSCETIRSGVIEYVTAGRCACVCRLRNLNNSI